MFFHQQQAGWNDDHSTGSGVEVGIASHGYGRGPRSGGFRGEPRARKQGFGTHDGDPQGSRGGHRPHRGGRIRDFRRGRAASRRLGGSAVLRRARIRHDLPVADRRARRRDGAFPRPRRAPYARTAHWGTDRRAGDARRVLHVRGETGIPAFRPENVRAGRRQSGHRHGRVEPVPFGRAAGGSAGACSPDHRYRRQQSRFMALCRPDPSGAGKLWRAVHRGTEGRRRMERRRLAYAGAGRAGECPFPHGSGHVPRRTLRRGRRLVGRVLPACRRSHRDPSRTY